MDLAIVIDMVGEDPEENGALPLVERMPDPGAIWDRPPLDVHSEWGRGDVRVGQLSGNFLNDYVMAAMHERQKRVDWPVRSNPYEGGSDHESFLERVSLPYSSGTSRTPTITPTWIGSTR